jgi:hypothetical protein
LRDFAVQNRIVFIRNRSPRMSANAAHALLTLLLGLAFGVTWLQFFWNRSRRVLPALLLAPAVVGIVGLGPWIA